MPNTAPLANNTVSLIIAYESGELGAEDILRLFGDLVASGLAWQLQGCYGRQAAAFIERGFLDRQGNVLRHIHDED